MNKTDFDAAFEILTDYPPFPWQWKLYDEWFVGGKFPDSCHLPTGLGKTSVIPIWLLALATAPPGKVPRRLVYVVNRRTVVDQSTREAEKMLERLPNVPVAIGALREMCVTENDQQEWLPLAISTLRGQFADNREWSADPARPAVVVGTVDMIGSRLLFSGYGVGFKAKPLHAGFLGQDVLVVHDEAHLERPFQKLLMAIRNEQERCNEFSKFRVMELSATSWTEGEVFELTEEEKNAPDKIPDPPQEPIHNAWRRLKARKTIHLHQNEDEKKLADEIGELVLKKHKDSGLAVLVFVRKVDDVEKVIKKLPKGSVQQLTGTLRGLERDRMADPRKKNGCPIFARFLKPPKADAPDAEQWKIKPKSGTVYLVCTSAGEVGVNSSGDHFASDLTTFESMAQRFGRVNRFGDRDDTRIDIVYPKEFDEKDDYDLRLKKTLELLRQLNGDGSPTALGKLDANARLAAFAKTPDILPTSDILFDAWALTTIRGKLPGRPIVEPYLHGLSDYDPPQTEVAWREEVECLTPKVLAQIRIKPEDLLEDYPLKPHEKLSGPTFGRNKVFEQLEHLAARDAMQEPDKRRFAWVIDPDGSVTVYRLEILVEKDKQNKPVISLGGRTVVLPPQAGGLNGGLLKGDEPFDATISYDVSDEWYADSGETLRRRVRVWDNDNQFAEKTGGMRLICRIDLPGPEDDEEAVSRSWHWFTRPKSADDDGSKTAKAPITWQHHTSDVEQGARRLADLLLKDHPQLHEALVLAAQFHDLGKMRVLWQKSIGNPNPTNWYAKSGKDPKTGRAWKPLDFTDYRHEFGSLLDLEKKPNFLKLDDNAMKDLVRHLIAGHHGYGRPHFPEDQAIDPAPPEGVHPDEIAREVPRRFARLQRKYGRWGLAYLESLLRAADWAASANPSKTERSK